MAAAAAWLAGSPTTAAAEPDSRELRERRRSPRPRLYRIEYSDPPAMVPYPDGTEDSALKALAQQQLVFLGQHPGSATDGELAATIFEGIAKRKGRGATMLGLDCVQQQFQPALDIYIASSAATNTARNGSDDAAEAALKRDAEWEERYPGSFEGALPLLRAARAQGARVVALGAAAESLARVGAAGLEGLSAEERNQYVVDLKG